MEGHAKIETFDYIGDDPATAPLLKQMRDANGKPHVCDHVWISYFTGLGNENGEGFGNLTAGYGSRDKPTEDNGNIGPEFTFGITMDRTSKEPVLIIKTAWGGKSLNTDFRPPSAGPCVPNEKELKSWEAKPELRQEKIAATGAYYRLMITHVKNVIKDIKRVCPAYDEKQGFEIAGFVWFQGFNDLVSGDVYPPDRGNNINNYSKYSEWLADFIRDVRTDLTAPKMPFVIGVLGVDGLNASGNTMSFREAMAAPATLPEFKGNVAAVQTAPFWDEKLGAIDKKHAEVRQMEYLLRTKNKNNANADGSMNEEQQKQFMSAFEARLISPEEAALWKRGASNAGYHYLGSAKTFALIGRAFAKALIGYQKDHRFK